MRSFIKSVALNLFLAIRPGQIRSDDDVSFARRAIVTALKTTIVAAEAATTSSSSNIETGKEVTSHSPVKFTKKSLICGRWSYNNISQDTYYVTQPSCIKSYNQISVPVDAPLETLKVQFSTKRSIFSTLASTAISRTSWTF